jgi:uncharacterized damage-inducible protein DinB
VPALPTIQDHLRRSFEGDAWHGPSMLEILQGVTAEQAAARPIANAHSIWELVLHVAAWEGVVVRRLQGEAVELTGAKDFPPVWDTSAAAWKRTIESLHHSHEALRTSVASLPESRLTDIVPGKEYTVDFMLQGVVQHDLYHAGQLVLLKKRLQPVG